MSTDDILKDRQDNATDLGQRLLAQLKDGLYRGPDNKPLLPN